MYDLLIHGGAVIDGTGRPRQTLDVAIRDGRIAALGRLERESCRRAIDARGRIVAPGFIDVHNHSEGWLLRQRHLLPKTSQGFTTEVLFSDGISYAPLSPELAADWLLYLRPLNGLEPSEYRGWRSIADYLTQLDGRTAQHVVAQIPYANLRVLACGWRRAAADDTEINLMRDEVHRAMQAGAVGISTGLDYIAQCFATTDEIARVCQPLAEYGGVYATHVRYKEGTLRGIEEAVEIGRRAGCAVHISHLKAFTPAETDAILDYIDRVASHEVEFSFDTYPYLSGSTLLASLLPYAAWEDGPLAAVAQLRRCDVRRQAARLFELNVSTPERIHLAWLRGRESVRWLGMPLDQFARAQQKPLADAVLDLLIDEQLAVLAVFRHDEDDRAAPFLAHRRAMIGSDGIYFPDGPVHPRVWGTAPRVLGPLVRDRRLFTLEEAVRKLSGAPAERFGLVDRGVIREGAAADLVVFDADEVTDRATFDEPHQAAVGIEWVLVAGEPIIAAGEPQHVDEPAQPGRALGYRRG